MNLSCPLCLTQSQAAFYSVKDKKYYQCIECQLIYLDHGSRLSEKDELAEYDLHQNSPSDQGYVNFLSKLLGPMLELIKPNSSGLDFGCGPGPTLSLLFEKQGHEVVLYDHYYYENISVFEKMYDFVTATEVLEHLYNPNVIIPKLIKLLNTSGVLGIMTKLSTCKNDFPNWHYQNDPTHVCFYSKETFMWIANRYNIKVKFYDKDVIIFTKESSIVRDFKML